MMQKKVEPKTIFAKKKPKKRKKKKKKYLIKV
jgi:hypothetical protein